MKECSLHIYNACDHISEKYITQHGTQMGRDFCGVMVQKWGIDKFKLQQLAEHACVSIKHCCMDLRTPNVLSHIRAVVGSEENISHYYTGVNSRLLLH